MNLFNRKTLKRHLHRIPEHAEHRAVLEAWAELITSQRIFGLKETALRGDFTAKIIENVLGYRGPAAGAEYTVAAEQAILRGSVDLALGRFGGKTADIVAPFELKGAATRDLDAIMPGRNKSPVQQAWEYAMNAPGVKWVLVSNMIELRLYGFGEGTAAYEAFRLDRLTQHDEYARFMLLLSAENLLSGRTLELLKESRLEDKDITGKLYDDYSRLRIKLIGAVQSAHKGIDPLDAIATAQKILDRVLFVAFAEDTGLLPGNTLADAFNARDRYNPRPVWENFKGLFNAIDRGSEELKIPRYNGGLFQADAGIDNIDLPDEVCEGFKALGEYDFASEVSVTVLGHIFEQSISDVERLQAHRLAHPGWRCLPLDAATEGWALETGGLAPQADEADARPWPAGLPVGTGMRAAWRPCWRNRPSWRKPRTTKGFPCSFSRRTRPIIPATIASCNCCFRAGCARAASSGRPSAFR